MEGNFEKIYQVVRRIPYGRVATYGQIARLLGNPRMSRIVGCALYAAPEGLPCHRVVNRFGGLSDQFEPAGKDSHRLLPGPRFPQPSPPAGAGGRAVYGGGKRGPGPLPVAGGPVKNRQPFPGRLFPQSG